MQRLWKRLREGLLVILVIVQPEDIPPELLSHVTAPTIDNLDEGDEADGANKIVQKG